MRAKFKLISDIGVPPDMSPERAKYIRGANVAAFATLFLHPLGGIGFYIRHVSAYPSLLVELLVIEVLLLFVFYLNKLHRYSWAVFYLGLLFNSHFVFFSVVLGPVIAVYPLIFVFSCRILLVPQSDQRLVRAIIFSDIALCFAALALPFFFTPWIVFGSQEAKVINTAILLFVFIGIIVAALIGRSETIAAEVKLRQEQIRSERLLLNILPQPIAERLKDQPDIIADYYPLATVLFADMVGFTSLAHSISADRLVYILNNIFSQFDDLTEKFGLEKIKTIGDGYMVAGGLPLPSEDHTSKIADLALEMRRSVVDTGATFDLNLRIRIGIDTGPVVAGVIGKSKFAYDLWGDMVNTASRMESNSQTGKIHVTKAFYEGLKEKYRFERRGYIDVKGLGKIETWFLLGRR
ncbi:adenylate/guanylate cyclase domain-containing protein [candidate division CSSED10-310 bacterium]|uniref:Adenylate/guanylate cyclase domain-containing protein n=1 Tax=candidate division CSSED10-310 bacterium TaxID=2855610 RepID=A0ABV6Z5I5_UNCC1